ncbi:MAG: serine/threonine protein kinase [Sedimenticola sp.]|uniref:non-specific serine/threonine protein kinase n=1 Tax=Sedimenticola thiotaurini TaxID=1543721 RepID=A0A558CS10_9GAMM|nr:serine/threonine protein kinase [Sedimenticola sp.]MDF1530182.1 serine/threonine-protein kinase [Sedimenticola sp.]TVT51550.1 MAG: serine/threonine protein kinase [Sedimenticola thiotaurini]
MSSSTEQNRDSLASGTIIDCYSIIKLIGSGGFSLIYLAEDEDNLDHVVIKEYLPKKLAVRDKLGEVQVSAEPQRDAFHNGRKLFYQEAKALAMLRHPNIVNVRTFFLANNTAYLVMDYEHGKNLGSYVKKRNGGLSTTFLLTVFPSVLDALNLIHSEGHLHLDIKPSNIHLRPGGNPLLLDFGAVHQFATTRSRQSSQVVTPGFAPVEQYYSSGYVGPWSDVYAIGATMRSCIEGKPPPSAIERHAKDSMKPIASLYKKQYPAYLLEVIDWAMEVDPLLRPQNAGIMLDALRQEQGRPANNSQPKLENPDELFRENNQK